jgi:hypothetical protein
MQQILDIEFTDINNDFMVSIFESIYSEHNPTTFQSMIDDEVHGIQATIEDILEKDEQPILHGIRCLREMIPDYEEIKERLNDVHQVLIMNEKVKAERRRTHTVYQHLKSTMKALKNSQNLLDIVLLINEELNRSSGGQCDLLYILQVQQA